MSKFTHLDESGKASMVDISGKEDSTRTAVAVGAVYFPAQIYQQLQSQNGQTAKGSITDIARIAGIMAAKQTSNLIPLCHPLPLNKIDVQFAFDDAKHALTIRATTRTQYKTGVEMEALTAVSTAALTVYDMCKALSHDIVIGDIQLAEKTGGKQDFHRGDGA